MAIQIRKSRRKGVALLLVLGILATTLGIGFVLIQQSATTANLSVNVDHQQRARLAAQTGIMIGLRAVQEGTWAGVATSTLQDLGNGDSFTISYAIGDPRLNQSSTAAEWAEYAMRVTISVVGTSQPAQPGMAASTHNKQAVVQLVRKQFQSSPAGWSDVQSYTLYAWDDGKALNMELPFCVHGDCYLQGALTLADSYPNDEGNGKFEGRVDDLDIWGSWIAYDPKGAPTVTWSGFEWDFDETDPATVSVDLQGNQDAVFAGVVLDKDGRNPDPDNAIEIKSGNTISLGGIDVWSNSQLSISVWIYLQKHNPRDHVIVEKSDGTNVYWAVGVDKNKAYFEVRSEGQTKRAKGTTKVKKNEWTHITGVYEDEDVKVYVNGVLDKTVAHSSSSSIVDTNSGAAVIMGRHAPGSALVRYLTDTMRLAKATAGPFEIDLRPFNGDITYHGPNQPKATKDLLKKNLGLVTSETPRDDTPPATHPGTVTSYQLFDGGPTYNIPVMPAEISGTEYTFDALTNPLGIYRCTGGLTLNDNSSITGMVITDGTVTVSGSDVTMDATNLPGLDGDSTIYQIPAVVGGSDIKVETGAANCQWQGLVYASKFELLESSVSSFQLTGKLVTPEIIVNKRSGWDLGESWWQSALNTFLSAEDGDGYYFPTSLGLSPVPAFYIQPETSATEYLWPDWSQPLYEADPTDGVLRWKIIWME